MKILVTGAAGFIGFHLSKVLCEANHEVVGLDNINDYYDINLKYARLNELGVDREKAEVFYDLVESNTLNNFQFIRMNLEDKNQLSELFKEQQFDVVCNLAAQAGVRYSIENPDVYIQSNIVGFLNILECSRHNKIKHLVYASSSSVYGLNDEIPFSEEHQVDTPVSLYAASKKSNELMAHTYGHLYNLPTTGLRFFTVYGPWGRPDMSPMLFAEAIDNNKAIQVFNYGKMQRDFTYVDDIVEGIKRVLEKSIQDRGLYKVYNIGNNRPVKLLDFISEIELNLGMQAEKNMMPIQMGDVEKTWADVSNLMNDYQYKPSTTVKTGIKNFIDWYSEYFNIKLSK